jgi:serine protease Do
MIAILLFHLFSHHNEPKPDVRDSIVSLVGISEETGRLRVTTGFVVHSKRVLTAGHFCVGIAEDLVVSSYNSPEHYIDGRITALDPFNDLCLVNVPTLDSPAVRWSGKADPGDLVTAVGSPAGVFPVERLGVILGTAERPSLLPAGEPLLHILAEIEPGFSGGPILDAKTERVLGMVSLGFRDPASGDWIAGMAIPESTIRAFLLPERPL